MKIRPKPLKVYPEFANLIKAQAAMNGKSVIKYTEELCGSSRIKKQKEGFNDWDFKF